MGGGGLENSGRHQLQRRTARGDRNKKSGSGQWPTGRRETPHGTAARRERPPERLGGAYARGVKAGPRIGEVPHRPPARRRRHRPRVPRRPVGSAVRLAYAIGSRGVALASCLLPSENIRPEPEDDATSISVAFATAQDDAQGPRVFVLHELIKLIKLERSATAYTPQRNRKGNKNRASRKGGQEIGRNQKHSRAGG